jgi:hypothetical protein
MVDHVILEYYKGDLYSIELITKGKSRVDSFSKSIELFYDKKFKAYDRTNKDGYFRKKWLYIDYRIYDNGEATFSIRNLKVKIPSWCGYKTPWSYYLKFWRW